VQVAKARAHSRSIDHELHTWLALRAQCHPVWTATTS
jgi:hypothetical protein